MSRLHVESRYIANGTKKLIYLKWLYTSKMNDFETLSGVFFRKVTVKPLKNYNFIFSYTICSV